MEPFIPPQVRHRLLEGFLARLARHPDAPAFALRGGMFVRFVLPQARRRAQDVDLVCALPYQPVALRRVLQRVLADRTVDDGVGFDATSLRVDGVWRGRDTPALCARARGAVGRVEGWITIDLLFGLRLWPPPAPATVSLPDGPAVLWLCRPETVIGRKIQVVTELGRGRWRAKDLADLHLLLQLDLDRDELAEAIDVAFEHGRGTRYEAREIFGSPAWWHHPTAAERWRRLERSAGHAVHPEVQGAVGAVAGALATVL